VIEDDYQLSFPAIRGRQASREYYVAMCPLHVAVDIIKLNEDDEAIPPELRAQRALNKGRVPAIAQYIIENPDSYAFSSLTISIDSAVKFEPMGKEGLQTKVGVLKVPYGVTYLINDGQHRRAAIEQALKENPRLKNETISLVIYIDRGLERSQQLFADLNRYVVRPTTSLSILYDHRDPLSRLSHDVIEGVDVFSGLTEKAKMSISNRSRKLFTLSSIYQATADLLKKKKGDEISDQESKLAILFWSEVVKQIPDWGLAAERKVAPSDLRSDTIHAHGIALRAIGRVGADLLTLPKTKWKKQLKGLSKIDWSRSNASLWEGRAMTAGKISPYQANIVLTGSLIKEYVELPLTPSEEEVEKEFKKRNS
jgi:DNA sulfur modification protein DndB